MSTVALITARGLFGRRRALILLPLPLLLIGLAAICRAYDLPGDQWGEAVIVGLGFAVVLPVVSLIVGTGVLGSEVDDGTLVHILTKPLPRRDIILAKYAVAAGASAVTSAVPLFVAGVLADSAKFGAALAVAAVVGAFAYSALFVLLSLVTRRPVLLGLVYILVWEGLLGRFLSGTRVLSIEQYVITIANKINPSTILDSEVGLGTAVIMSAVFVVGCTLAAINRLGSFSLAGETS
ncbi:ABC-2 type transport system permease protein [Actinoplanes lutulentus]|uniref:ABC-2 type transport system permease protein n=1 Tax=Actinoplanes lutulentus TaxID=1287878 RepID=A0A327ZND3_9ACTN|nr:ABC transporter permease [Actinoplanes lutulentus]MBB2945517.1 ABC-2 type transport system permease protein [Actinoplanes lutulentus]RAK40351.1 ABC-2 type transport system permease protein [Actinoplanes lutulentus]